ncbi:MAG: hypothetical protein ACRDNF_12835 [Streptosporangiaceae bacterium]
MSTAPPVLCGGAANGSPVSVMGDAKHSGVVDQRGGVGVSQHVVILARRARRGVAAGSTVRWSLPRVAKPRPAQQVRVEVSQPFAVRGREAGQELMIMSVIAGLGSR